MTSETKLQDFSESYTITTSKDFQTKQKAALRNEKKTNEAERVYNERRSNFEVNEETTRAYGIQARIDLLLPEDIARLSNRAKLINKHLSHWHALCTAAFKGGGESMELDDIIFYHSHQRAPIASNVMQILNEFNVYRIQRINIARVKINGKFVYICYDGQHTGMGLHMIGLTNVPVAIINVPDLATVRDLFIDKNAGGIHAPLSAFECHRHGTLGGRLDGSTSFYAVRAVAIQDLADKNKMVMVDTGEKKHTLNTFTRVKEFHDLCVSKDGVLDVPKSMKKCQKIFDCYTHRINGDIAMNKPGLSPKEMGWYAYLIPNYSVKQINTITDFLDTRGHNIVEVQGVLWKTVGNERMRKEAVDMMAYLTATYGDDLSELGVRL